MLISVLISPSIFIVNGSSINQLAGAWQSDDIGVLTTLIFYDDNSFEYIFAIDEESEPEILKGQYVLNEGQLLLTLEHGASSTYEIVELNNKSLILRYKETLISYSRKSK
ncbi:MAG: hypothetical protein GQ574_21975 [Crocinitomix sp.]|nr:hypothetical protein [Crocinitomix sp.]